MARFAPFPTMAALMAAFILPAAAPPAAAEPMKGRYELRCQDPQTRQWTVAGQVTDPEIADRSGTGGKAGGREVRGTGADGKPVVLPMPSDRTCMLSAR
ncbi:hypothetical protein VY88_28920 [Azospirillum thiophilum]|uniref:Uncharacterized protein n=1 Tax=Azospirillum thiophilum TaxID=528244 RepID=A0AAC8W685_9PROT|nr:hypothetical protein [Azospirillum thiophilum]ALG75605.1 hypothetical protein AL072_32250 [Azospirillum thiophilum]KJR62124.1 hypothetical protein VY88_28920 [Azospirillum thiophilum]